MGGSPSSGEGSGGTASGGALGSVPPCDDGWEGPACDYRWNPVVVPPFAQALRFDSSGNAWFGTTKGLLYWDLKSTPETTSDDTFALFPELGALPELAIDSMDRLWFVSGRKVFRLDPGGTPGERSDDELLESTPPSSYFDSLLHLSIDDQARIWIIARSAKGVLVLENPADFTSDAAEWVELFADTRVLSLAPEGSGVWVATDEGLRYVDLGSSLADSADDTWIHFDDVPLVSGQEITGIFVGSDGTKWLNTEQSIVTLVDGGAPLNKSGHSWSSWTPPAAVLALGDGPLLELGPDGAPWLAMPYGSAVRVSPEGAGAATAYAPAESPLASSEYQTGVSTVSQHGAGQFWVTLHDEGYLFQGAGTPYDSSDDEWFMVRKARHQPFGGSFPESSGGRWVSTLGRSRGPNTCSSLLYYSRLGEPSSGWDDEWTLVFPFDGDPGCFSLAGVDAREQVWVNFSWKFGYSATCGLDGPAFLSGEREEVLVRYAAEDDEMVSGPISFSLGTDRPLFGGREFSSGASLVDKSDDEWGPEVPGGLGQVDSLGYSWHASGSGSPAPLWRFDDGGTGQDTTDDEMLLFSGSEAVPISLATWLWIDELDWKWLQGMVNGEPTLISFNDGGTPHDPSDDEWRSYEEFEVAHGKFMDIEQAGSHDLWVATETDFGILELRR